MFDVLFNHRQRIALVRFRGPLTMADLTELEVVGRCIAAHEAPAWRILDFSAVESVQIPTTAIASLGMARSIAGNRIYVVPRPELFGLARVYSTYQRHSGGNEPVLVETFADACATIGCTPAFEPYAIDDFAPCAR